MAEEAFHRALLRVTGGRLSDTAARAILGGLRVPTDELKKVRPHLSTASEPVLAEELLAA